MSPLPPNQDQVLLKGQAHWTSMMTSITQTSQEISTGSWTEHKAYLGIAVWELIAIHVHVHKGITKLQKRYHSTNA